jgi:hypothetical protein
MASNGAARTLTLLATIVRVVCSLIAALIVIHALFIFFEANHTNPLVEITTSVRDTFGWFTKNLFRMDDRNIAEAINDAIAALIYVVVGNLLSKLILRFAPATKAKV